MPSFFYLCVIDKCKLMLIFSIIFYILAEAIFRNNTLDNNNNMFRYVFVCVCVCVCVCVLYDDEEQRTGQIASWFQLICLLLFNNNNAECIACLFVCCIIVASPCSLNFCMFTNKQTNEQINKQTKLLNWQTFHYFCFFLFLLLLLLFIHCMLSIWWNICMCMYICFWYSTEILIITATYI